MGTWGSTADTRVCQLLSPLPACPPTRGDVSLLLTECEGPSPSTQVCGRAVTPARVAPAHCHLSWHLAG